MRFHEVLLCCQFGLLLPQLAHADTQVNVVGLFNGKAVLIINSGKPQTLTVGQSSSEGVKLLAADSNKAVLEIGGKRQELGMGQAASVGGKPSQASNSVTLFADQAGHHFSDGQINGVPIRFLVDTGATALSISSKDAKRAGIDYSKGEKIAVQAAGGLIAGYRVVINSIKLGAVPIYQVDTIVLEGDAPAVALLGMSVLNRMDMKRDGIALTLTSKY